MVYLFNKILFQIFYKFRAYSHLDNNYQWVPHPLKVDIIAT